MQIRKIMAILLVLSILLNVRVGGVPVNAMELGLKPADGTTVGQPFPSSTAGSKSFRIPVINTLDDGTIIAAADARWNTTYDGGGLDTIVSRSTDGGDTWNYTFANFLGDNGNTYNGSESTTFIDPLLITEGQNVYLFCDIYPYGVALNGKGNHTPEAVSGFNAQGKLLLKKDDEFSYDYYLDGNVIKDNNDQPVDGYSVDDHFFITYNGEKSNLFFKDSPFKVQRTSYIQMVKSSDGGRTWGAPKLLNVKTNAELAYLVAPGNGFISKTGRMVVPTYSYGGSNESQRTDFIYSDDRGKTWHRSSTANTYQNPTNTWSSESSAVELKDGSYRFFFRNGTARLCYIDYRNDAWQTPVKTDIVVNSNTELAAIKYSKKVEGKELIVVSAPAGANPNIGSTSSAGGAGGQRKNGRIFFGLVENDSTMTWLTDNTINIDNSANSNQFMYSSITELKDGKIGMLYEDSQVGWGAGYNKYFTMKYITKEITGITFSDVQTDFSDTQIASEPELVSYSDFKLNLGKNLLLDDWKFNLGDLNGAQNSTFDDSRWNLVDLPHDFSISQEYTNRGEAESGFLLGGIGWYRKSFNMPNTVKDFSGKAMSLDNKRVYINFDGVYMNADVYLNGEKLASHPYGYTAFSVDLTDKIKYNEENVLAVRVDSTLPTSRWYSGSGIYRNVSLEIRNEDCIAKDSVVLSNSTNSLNAKVSLLKGSQEEKDYQVSVDVIDPKDNSVVANSTKDIKLSDDMELSIDTSVNGITTWDIDNPKMYKVVVSLKDKLTNSTVVDSVDVDYGFRTFAFDANSGFSLNGKNVKLQGVCMHHDQGALGAVANPDAIARQFDILKKMGVNAIRTSHNPAAADFIRLANEKGLLVIEEAFDGWKKSKNGNHRDYTTYFAQTISADNKILGAKAGMTWGEFDTKAMIKRDINAPSIILWSTGNEVRTGASGYMSDYPEVAKNIATWMKEADPSRAATIGDNEKDGNAIAQGINNNIAALGGVIGYNYARQNDMVNLHNKHPEWKMYASETSSAVNSRGVYNLRGSAKDQNKFNLTSYDESTVGWGQVSSDDWYNIITKDYVAGNFIWTGFDYLGEPTPWWSGSVDNVTFPRPKSSYFGIVDTAGLEKDRYYFYSSQWRDDITTLHMLPAWYDGISEQGNNIVVYSNAPKVKLFFTKAGEDTRALVGEQTMEKVTTVAGHSYMTTKKSGNHTDLYYMFRKTYEPGKLEVEAYDENDKLISNTFGRNVVQTTGEAKKISLRAEKAEVKASIANENKHLVYVNIDLLDEDDNLVENAENQVKVRVSGAGKLVALDNGVQADMSSYFVGTKKARAGRLVAIVESADTNGVINVTATAEGLKSATTTVNVTGADSNTADIVGYKYSKYYTVVRGTSKLVLPVSVRKVLGDGSEVNVDVDWDSVSASELDTVGTFKVNGVVADGNKISVFVNVIEQVNAVLNYSTFTRKGYVPSLPSARPAVSRDAEVLNSYLEVKWNETDLRAERFAELGEVVVNGEAKVFGRKIPVTANVRVTDTELEYLPSQTSAAQFTLLNSKAFANKDKLLTSNEVAFTSEANDELKLSYATGFSLGRVELYYEGEEPDVELAWAGGDGASYSVIDAGITKEAGKVVYDFNKVPMVALKMKFKNAGVQVKEIKLIEVDEKVSVGNTTELKRLFVNGAAVARNLLTEEEITSPEESGEIVAEAKDNAAVTIMPIIDKTSYIFIESEDHETRIRKTLRLGQGEKDTILSTNDKGGVAFAYFTNDKDPNSKDKVENINNDRSNDGANYRWSDWQRNNKLRENYIGLILPKVDELNPTISKLMYHPWVELGGSCQLPTQMLVQVYTGDEYTMPSPISRLREVSGNPFVDDANWKTIKTVDVSTLKPNEDNFISLDEPVETTAIRLNMKQRQGKCFGLVELDAYGKYIEKVPVLVSQNDTAGTLPMPLASYTCSGDSVYHMNDGVVSFNDAPKNRWTNWVSNTRSSDWVGMLLGEEKTPLLHKVSKIDITFFEDFGCKIPADFTVEYLDPSVGKPKAPKSGQNGALEANARSNKVLSNDDNWKPVTGLVGNEGFTAGKNTLTFDEVETCAIRIKMNGKPGMSLALTELEVYGYATETAQEQVEKENPALEVFPSLRKYDVTEGALSNDELKRVFVVLNDKAKKEARLADVVGLVREEFALAEVPSSEKLPMISGEASEIKAGDIVIEMQDDLDELKTSNGFIIEVSDKVVIKAEDTNGVMYALRVVMQFMMTKDEMPKGRVVDYPETEERALHLDMGRKYFTPEWIKETIKELSFDRLNAIQLHFGEKEGFRLESETYPEVMSKDYITKEEMRDIIATAKKYGVDIIPALDSPGHIETALREHPEFWLKNRNGVPNRNALDINNDEARMFIKNLIKEYAELFADSKYFHIGGDEFMIPFDNCANYPSIAAFGQKHLPSGVQATWYDGYVAYTNEIAAYVKELGFTPRAWNDGLYYGNYPRNIELDKDIEVCVWTKWSGSMASTDTFIENGHKLVNVNDMMYYVLRRDNGAYSTPPDPQRIYDTWDAGVFPANQNYDVPNDNIVGTCYAIWCDHQEVQTQEEVTEGIFYSLRAMAEKSWSGTREDGEYYKFKELLDKIGKAKSVDLSQGLEKFELPTGMVANHLKCKLENVEQSLGYEQVRIGKVGDTYSYETPKFKGFELVSTQVPLSGKFVDGKTITLLYKPISEVTRLEKLLENVFEESNYVAETYASYKQAVAEGRKVVAMQSPTNAQVMKAMSDIRASEKGLVKVQFETLYNRLKTLKDRTLYTSQSYKKYEKKVEEIRALITGTDKDESKVAEYTAMLDKAESGLVELGDLVEVNFSITDGIGNDHYDNHTFNKMFDGDLSTFAWTNFIPEVGQHFNFEFTSEVELSKFTLKYPSGVGEDYVHNGELQVFTNGEWKKVGDLSGSDTQEIAIGKVLTNKVRIEFKEPLEFWVKMAEVELDYKKPGTEPEEYLVISKNIGDEALPMAIASFTNDKVIDENSNDKINLINDGVFGYIPSQPANRWTNWRRTNDPNYHTSEWVGIVLGSEDAVSLHKVKALDVSFFEDNGCKVPESFKVEYLKKDVEVTLPASGFEGHLNKDENDGNSLVDDNNWVEVTNLQGATTVSEIVATEKNKITFDEVETAAIRINMNVQNGKCLAVTELEVYGEKVKEQTEVDTTALRLEITKAEAAKTTVKYNNATKDKKTAFDEALSSAKSAVTDDTLTQEQINTLANELAKVTNELDGQPLPESKYEVISTNSTARTYPMAIASYTNDKKVDTVSDDIISGINEGTFGSRPRWTNWKTSAQRVRTEDWLAILLGKGTEAKLTKVDKVDLSYHEDGSCKIPQTVVVEYLDKSVVPTMPAEGYEGQIEMAEANAAALANDDNWKPVTGAKGALTLETSKLGEKNVIVFDEIETYAIRVKMTMQNSGELKCSAVTELQVYGEEVDEATSVDKTALKGAIDIANQAKSTVKYTNATKDKKTDFDDALKAAKEALTNSDLTQDEVNSLTDELTDAVGQLDGQEITQEDEVISKNIGDEALPMAIASFTNDKVIDKNSNDKINLINDDVFGYIPSQPANRWTNWRRTNDPNYHTSEWVGIVLGSEDAASLHKVKALDVSFFEDNGCKVPENFKVEYLKKDVEVTLPASGFEGHLNKDENDGNSLADDNNWVEVTNLQGATTVSEIVATEKNKITFDEVETAAIRINMNVQNGKCLAVTELEVYGEKVKEVDTKALTEEIVKAEAAKATVKYTKATKDKKTAFDEALKAAEAGVTNDDLSQDEVDELVSKLHEATEALDGVEATVVDKKLLTEEIAKAESAKATVKYTKATKDKKTAFDEALKAAEAGVTNDDLSQDEVDELVSKLHEATEALDGVEATVVDKKLLTEEIAKAEAAKATVKYTKATKDKKTAFDEALKAAEAGVTNDDLSQDEVDELVSKLHEATEALDGVEVVDKTALTSEIAKAKSVKATVKYTKATNTVKLAFEKALEKAEKLLELKDITQVELDNAKVELEKAKSELDGRKVTFGDDIIIINYDDDKTDDDDEEDDIVDKELPFATPEVEKRYNDIVEDISSKEDKKLIEKLVKEKVTYKEFVEEVSDETLEEYAQHVEEQFVDEKKDNWYSKELSAMRVLNLVKGYEDKTFRNENNVTGKEFITMLVRAANKEPEKADEKDWFAPYNKVADEIGLLEKLDFDLSKELTREQIAFIAFEWLHKTENDKDKKEEDKKENDKKDKKYDTKENEKVIKDLEKVNNSYLDAVHYLYSEDILKGYEDETFRPENNVKRSEIIAIIYRILKHK